MAYSPVPLVTTGDFWTASNHNTYVRDNFAQTSPHIVNTAGDLIYANTATTIARLAMVDKGIVISNDTVPIYLSRSANSYDTLMTNIDNDGIEWINGTIGEYAYGSAAGGQSINPSTYTAVNFSYAGVGTWGMFNPAYPTRLTIPANFPAICWVHIQGYFHWDGLASTTIPILSISLGSNGLRTATRGQGISPYGSDYYTVFHMNFNYFRSVTPGTYYELLAYHEHTSAIKVFQPRFGIFLER